MTLTIPAWLDRATARTLAIAATTAVILGASTGGALSLPRYLAEPIAHEDLDLANAEDPGHAEWQTRIAGLGGLEATRVIAAAYVEPLPTDRRAYDHEMRDVYARLDALDAEIEASAVAWSREQDWNNSEVRRAAEAEALRRQGWVQDDNFAQSHIGFQPAAYVEMDEQEPVPPPVPVPTGW